MYCENKSEMKVLIEICKIRWSEKDTFFQAFLCSNVIYLRRSRHDQPRSSKPYSYDSLLMK